MAFALRSFSLLGVLGLVACSVAPSVDDVSGTAGELNTARIGPKATPSVKRFEGQKGALWELPSGDILTSFDVGSGMTHRFSLRTIQGTEVTLTPNTSSGSCTDHFGPYYGCQVGPGGSGTEFGGWFVRRALHEVYYNDADVEDRAVMLTDGLYIAQATYQPGPPAKVGPGIVRLDPTTGKSSVMMTITDAYGSTDPQEKYYRMRELPDGKLAFSYRSLVHGGGPQPVPRTLVVTRDGSVVRSHDGWLVEARPKSAEVFLTQGTTNTWWNTTTDAASPAPDVPSTGNLHIARNGDIVSLSQTEIGYFTRDRSIAQRSPVGWGAVDLLAVLPDGGYITQEFDGVAEATLLKHPRKAPVTLSTRASILAETQWWLGGSSFELPTYDGAGTAVVDDDGNSYISYHRRSGGESYNSYVVSYDARGARRWGALASDAWSKCYPWTVLSGSRVAMRCASAYSGDMVLLSP